MMSPPAASYRKINSLILGQSVNAARRESTNTAEVLTDVQARTTRKAMDVELVTYL
jgi:hypothetical protein